MNFLHHLDLAFLRQINTVWTSPFLDRLMAAVSDPHLFVWPVTLAALVAYSRVYLAAHYPSDVLGSLFLSIAYSTAILAGARLAWARWAPSKWRAAHPELLPLWRKKV